jgi:hypothetical protein
MIWGQYFYIPFFVENTELHIGPRPKTGTFIQANSMARSLKKSLKIRLSPPKTSWWVGLQRHKK